MRRGLALGLVLLAGACAPAAGQVERQPRFAARILSLNPCTDAILAEVADPAQIVGLSAYSRDRAQASMDVAVARRFPVVDGTLEEVVAARPTLVVSGSFTPPASRAAMGRLGLRLEEFTMPATVEESVAQVRRMAALAGQPARGEALVARIEQAVAQAKSDRAPVSALVWQGGGLVAGPQTLISDLLGRTGFVPLAATKGLGQAQFLPLEEVVADPPRVILAVRRSEGHSGEGHSGEASRGLGHPALAGLKATQRFYVEPALEYCGGPTIMRAARRLAAIRRAVG